MLHVSRSAARVERAKLLRLEPTRAPAAFASASAVKTRAPATRFAPAPTGYLHLGHVLNAMYVWGVAAAVGARVLLRIEDHDRQRSRREYESALVQDLEWLGFEPHERSRQSDREAIYQRALTYLRVQGLTYACDCTRRQIPNTGRELRYDGRCRTRELDERSDRGIRLRIDPGEERFDDLLLGPQQQDPATQSGDVLLRDRHGLWTYQFAATVDDVAQNITHVIRGEDLLESTGRQIRLARLLGRDEPPVFLHHPLIMKSPAQKVSKSDADTGIRELRAGGWSPQQVIGFTAALAGLLDSPRDVDVADLANLVCV